MKILFVSNVYPPHYVGGYELACNDVVDALSSIGHDIEVITSDYTRRGVPSDFRDPANVYRELRCFVDWNNYDAGQTVGLAAAPIELHNQRAFERRCKRFKPDIIFFWGMIHLSLSIVGIAQRLGIPSSYYVFDDWPKAYFADPWFSIWKNRGGGRRHIWRKCLIEMLGALGLFPFFEVSFRMTNALFASDYLLREAQVNGTTVTDPLVMPWGLVPNLYEFAEQPLRPTVGRLLFVGQVVEHKGVHTLIEAFKDIKSNSRYNNVKLTIAGGSATPAYFDRIVNDVAKAGLSEDVKFAGMVARDRMAELYSEHDILIFPSIFDEPFGMAILEAMASGVVVVGTGTGGSGEIMANNENCLLFTAGDPSSCAARIKQLIDEPTFYQRLRRAGRKTVEEKYNLTQVIPAMESYLSRVVSSRDSLGALCESWPEPRW